MNGCCSDNKLCSYHNKYPNLFYYLCPKCKKYYGASIINGHEVTVNTMCGHAPLPTKTHWLAKTMTMYNDMNIFMAICEVCGKCKCCWGEKQKWATNNPTSYSAINPLNEQLRRVKELEDIL